MRNWRRNGGEAIVLQSPILGTHFITPMGHTNSAHHLRAIALRVLQSPILGTHFITPMGHTNSAHHLRAIALRVLQSPILGTHFITPMGHTNSAHHLRAIALRVLQSPILGTHFITPMGHTNSAHHLRALALRVLQSPILGTHLFPPRPMGTRVDHPLRSHRSLRGRSLRDSPPKRCRAPSPPRRGTIFNRTISTLTRSVGSMSYPSLRSQTWLKLVHQLS